MIPGWHAENRRHATLHDQGDPASVVSVWIRGNGTAGWHCEECGRGCPAGDCEAACRDAGAHRCPPGETGEQDMTSSWSPERMAAAAQERDAELAQAEEKRVAVVRSRVPAGSSTRVTRSLCWLPPDQAGYHSREEQSGGWSRQEETWQLAGRIGYRTDVETLPPPGSSCTCGAPGSTDWRGHAGDCPRGIELARQAIATGRATVNAVRERAGIPDPESDGMNKVPDRQAGVMPVFSLNAPQPTAMLPHREPSGQLCWGPHPPRQPWACGCTPGPTRHGNLVPDPPAHPAGVITSYAYVVGAGGTSSGSCTCGSSHISDWRVHASACPRGGELARQAAAGKATGRTGQVTIEPCTPPDPPADCQEALHREVTGRAPPPTLEGWRDEFVAFGGDYARQRMLSYVTPATRCVIDPPGKTAPGGDLARWPQIRGLVLRSGNFTAAIAVAIVILITLGYASPAAVLVILLAVVAVVRR